MIDKLLPNQKVLYNKIVENINNQNIIISGKTGCGKSEMLKVVAEYFRSCGYNILLFDNGQVDSKRSYYPLLSGMQFVGDPININDIGIKLSKDSPILPNTLQIFAKRIFDRNYNSLKFLNEIEKELYDKLSLFIKNSNNNVLILCDNIHYWDRESLSFINILFKNKYIYETLSIKAKFIFCHTQNQDCTDDDLIDFLWKDNRFLMLSFKDISLLSFKKSLEILGLKKNLSQNEYKILYHLIDGHIQVIVEVIKELNDDRLDFDKTYQTNIDLLKPIILERLKCLGALGSFIDETLKYASLMGINFDKLELSKIADSFDKEAFDFTQTLTQAENIFLIKKQESSSYSFVHEIIMQVFEANIPKISRPQYYFKLAKCLQQIKPHDYLRRAYCLVNTELQLESAKAFALYLIQQFKEGSEIGDSTYNEISPRLKSLSVFVNNMKQAYSLYHKKKYKETYYALFSIPDIYSNDLLAEKYLLMSCCQTKSILTSDKNEAILNLLKYDEISKVNGEIDVYENILERLMICYIHFGNIAKARGYEEKFISSIAKRIDYDAHSKYKLYKLYRKANALYDSDLAYIKLKQSISFFSTNDMQININDLYITLTNTSCTLIKLGKFVKAYETALKGIELENMYPHISYKRTQIIRSNLCISGVLSGKITLQNAINIIKEIKDSTPIIPERIYHTINLTSLYALNNQVEMAFSILESEANLQCYQDDVEGIYHYYVIFNITIFKYLLNAKDINQYIGELEEMKIELLHMLDSSYMIERNRLLIEIFRKKIACKPDKWIDIVFKRKPKYQNEEIWNFWGLGYAFVALSNWE